MYGDLEIIGQGHEQEKPNSPLGLVIPNPVQSVAGLKPCRISGKRVCLSVMAFLGVTDRKMYMRKMKSQSNFRLEI